MTLACATCPVKERAACSVLTDEERGELARAGRTVRLKRGEMLFAAGDEDHACATLLTGALKVSSVDREGEERILALIHPAGFVGELFQPFAHHDVVALTDCDVITIPPAAAAHALALAPELAALIEQLAVTRGRRIQRILRRHMDRHTGNGVGSVAEAPTAKGADGS